MGISSCRGLARLAVDVHNIESRFSNKSLPHCWTLRLSKIGPKFSFPQRSGANHHFDFGVQFCNSHPDTIGIVFQCLESLRFFAGTCEEFLFGLHGIHNLKVPNALDLGRWDRRMAQCLCLWEHFDIRCCAFCCRSRWAGRRYTRNMHPRVRSIIKPLLEMLAVRRLFGFLHSLLRPSFDRWE